MSLKEVIMPAYDYDCKDCHKDFTIYLSLKEFEEKPEIKCPHCDSNNVHKKISGFYAKTSSKS